jgi:Domain of unknown function (DUF4326)
MTSPQRIQRKRIKGWKAPPNTVYVGRGSVWGNPFIVGERCGIFPKGMGLRGNAETLIQALTLAQCLEFYRNAIEGYLKPEMYPAGHEFSTKIRPHSNLHFLRGKNLMCWCPADQPCHADILLELANA